MSLWAGVDLGKTGCRAVLADDDRVVASAEGPGARGLADPGGTDAATAAVSAVIAEARITAALDGETVIDVVVVGAAGTEGAERSETSLVDRLPAILGATSVGLASDAVTSHAGAFAGEPGAMIAIGTGSVAVGLGPGGMHQVDGQGFWLGDEGSGAWIGRAGLAAVLRARDGRSGPTALTDAAAQRYGDLGSLHATVVRRDAIAADTAAFARDVLTCAEAGDAAARAIVAEAGVALAASVSAAARASGVDQVAAVGGLAASSLLMAGWREALDAGLTVVEPRGTSLDGALLLARRTDLPHEPHVRRS